MLTRLTFRGVWKAFTGKQDAKDWQEAYEQAKARIDHLEKQLYELEKSIVQFTQTLNNPGVLSISQATIEGSAIGAENASTGRFTAIGVNYAAPTNSWYVATLGGSSGRQWTESRGGTGSSEGPGVVFSYGTATPIQGIGGYSSLLGGAFDDRFTLYAGSKDLVLRTGSTSKQIDFGDSTNGAGASAGTLTNAPSAGDPTIWLKVKIDGNVRYIPAWA